VWISIPVQLAHGPQSAYRDLLRTSLISRQRCIFAMEGASREESQARSPGFTPHPNFTGQLGPKTLMFCRFFGGLIALMATESMGLRT
jgi:hypothetical protein